MSLFDRVSRVARANMAHQEAMNYNPDAALSETIQDLTQSILNLTQSIAVAESTHKKLEAQYQQTLLEVNEWNRKVGVARQKDREDLAREALIREQASKQKAINQKTQIKVQQSSLDALKTNLENLKTKLAQLQSKKVDLASKSALSTSADKTTFSASSSRFSPAMDSFKQLEEKMAAIELESEKDSTNLDFKDRFAPSDVPDIKAEVEAMMAELLKSTTVAPPVEAVVVLVDPEFVDNPMQIKNYDAKSQKLQQLGYFQVSIDLTESSWAVLQEHNQNIPPLWLRHTPKTGEKVLFSAEAKTFRGTVTDVAHAALETDDCFADNSLDIGVFSVIHLLVDEVEVCMHPVEGSIWYSE